MKKAFFIIIGVLTFCVTSCAIPTSERYEYHYYTHDGQEIPQLNTTEISTYLDSIYPNQTNIVYVYLNKIGKFWLDSIMAYRSENVNIIPLVEVRATDSIGVNASLIELAEVLEDNKQTIILSDSVFDEEYRHLLPPSKHFIAHFVTINGPSEWNKVINFYQELGITDPKRHGLPKILLYRGGQFERDLPLGTPNGCFSEETIQYLSTDRSSN